MKGIHLALIPAVTLASGTVHWEKVNHCLDRDVLSNQLQGISNKRSKTSEKTFFKICYNYLLNLLEIHVMIVA